MDYVLDILDDLVYDRFYAKIAPCNETFVSSPKLRNKLYGELSCVDGSILKRDHVVRQFVSLFLTVWFFGMISYFLTASLSFLFVFDKRTMNHPRYLKNQAWQEIALTTVALPFMSLLTTPWFLFEIRGYSKLYENVADHGVWYLFAQIVMFLVFTDCLIYYIHRGLHHPLVYRHLHKPHHRWIVPTPFASHAFHPVDGYLQSLPYHIFPFIFPLHKLLYLALFGFVNIWTVLIHDGEILANNAVINGAACHTIHHLYYRYNYGQFTTFWDRLGGSYRRIDKEMLDPKLKTDETTWQKQANKVDEIIKEEEIQDCRVYAQVEQNKKCQ